MMPNACVAQAWHFLIADLDTRNEGIYSHAGSFLDLSRRSPFRRFVSNCTLLSWTGKWFSQPMVKFNKMLCGWAFYAPDISPRYI
jgi:hypothetical protein